MPNTVPDDTVCLQCGETRGAVRTEGFYCVVMGVGESPEVEADWDRHRWRSWTDRELDRMGVVPAAYEKHRRTPALHFGWLPCEDTKTGHTPATAEGVTDEYGWASHVGQCIHCGKDATPTEEKTDG